MVYTQGHLEPQSSIPCVWALIATYLTLVKCDQLLNYM